MSGFVLSNGEQLYLNKQYDAAELMYQKAIKNEPNNASHHYNLGAVMYRKNQLVSSKIHFLNAQKLLPTHPNIQHNLSIINTAFIDQDHVGHAPFNWHLFGLNPLVIQNFTLGIIFMAIIWLVLRKIKIFHSYIDRLGTLGVVFTLMIAGVVLAASVQLPDYGIVSDEKVSIFSGPSTTQQPLFYVHEGAEFKVTDSGGGWLNIQFNNGLKGWIEETAVHIL